VLAAAERGQTGAAPAPGARARRIRADGGYGLLQAVQDGADRARNADRDPVQRRLARSGRRGFPAGRKWSIVRAMPGGKLMTINADEGEPGTFKDRVLLEADPHRVLEGALIAAMWCRGRAHLHLPAR
jgi:NADH:ubiquinone oxidoreductase subunit F (NADH-binding)